MPIRLGSLLILLLSIPAWAGPQDSLRLLERMLQVRTFGRVIRVHTPIDEALAGLRADPEEMGGWFTRLARGRDVLSESSVAQAYRNIEVRFFDRFPELRGTTRELVVGRMGSEALAFLRQVTLEELRLGSAGAARSEGYAAGRQAFLEGEAAAPGAGLPAVDCAREYREGASASAAGVRFYYGAPLAERDAASLATDASRVRLAADSNISDRSFAEVLRRIGVSEPEVTASAGERWVSVGEGNSDFVAQSRLRGVNATAVDALVANPHAPEHSVIAYAQDLPFLDGTFDRTVSVWLVPHFFRPGVYGGMFNPEAGRRAILEMVRVTRVGGEIRLGPVTQDSAPVFDFLDHLRTRRIVEYEVFPNALTIIERPVGSTGRVTAVVIPSGASGQYQFVRIRRLR